MLDVVVPVTRTPPRPPGPAGLRLAAPAAVGAVHAAVLRRAGARAEEPEGRRRTRGEPAVVLTVGERVVRAARREQGVPVAAERGPGRQVELDPPARDRGGAAVGH